MVPRFDYEKKRGLFVFSIRVDLPNALFTVWESFFFLDDVCIKEYFCHARKIFDILLIIVPSCCFPDVAGSYSLHGNQGLITAALVGRVTLVV